MRLVKFGNGKYGIRRYRLFEGYSFLGMNAFFWWSNPKQIALNAQGTETEALTALENWRRYQGEEAARKEAKALAAKYKVMRRV